MCQGWSGCQGVKVSGCQDVRVSGLVRVSGCQGIRVSRCQAVRVGQGVTMSVLVTGNLLLGVNIHYVLCLHENDKLLPLFFLKRLFGSAKVVER